MTYIIKRLTMSIVNLYISGENMAHVTILDIARESGVSTATVSRALNNPELVSEKTRNIIMQVVEKHNYTLNAAAQELVTQRTRLIGVLIYDVANDYISAVLESFSAELARDGYGMLISVSNMLETTELASIENLKSKRVEAIVLLGNRLLNPTHDHLLVSKLQGIPILRIGNTTCKDFYCVAPDEEEGSFRAIEYLIQLGHTRIAFLNGSKNIDSYYYKQKGFERAMKTYGVPMRSEYVVELDTSVRGQSFYTSTLELLKLPERPTAFFTIGDQAALGIYKAAGVLGYRIPQDLSVIGFSGSPISEVLYPELTTVSQYASATGKLAEKHLINILNGESDVPKCIKSRTELLIRDSCGPVSDC